MNTRRPSCSTEKANKVARLRRIEVLPLVREHRKALLVLIEAKSIRKRNGCRDWLGIRNTDGKARLSFRGKMYSVNRLVWALEHDTEPHEAVMHFCDRPECVAIEHLRNGTVAENNWDSFQKGRRRLGEDHPKSKLTQAQAIQVGAWVFEGLSDREISRRLDNLVDRKSIESIRVGDSWNHATGIKRKRGEPPTIDWTGCVKKKTGESR